MIVDQLWTFDRNILISVKVGINWAFGHTKWSIPDDGKEGYVEDIQSNEVLGIVGEPMSGAEVTMQTNQSLGISNQKWIRKRYKNYTNWFTLTNSNTGLFLTCETKTLNGITNPFLDGR